VGVSVIVGVPDGGGVSVGVNVTVSEGVAVTVGVGVAVDVNVAVCVDVGVAVGVKVGVDEGAAVGVGVRVAVRVGVGVAVEVGGAVLLGVGELVAAGTGAAPFSSSPHPLTTMHTAATQAAIIIVLARFIAPPLSAQSLKSRRRPTREVQPCRNPSGLRG
jgi:hypothetical protein